VAGSFTSFPQGTGFLTNYHDELGALLNGQVTTQGDSPAITPALLDESQQAFGGAGGTSFLVLFLDPVSLSVADSQNRRAVFDQRTNQVTNTQPKTYVEVGGNIEVVVVADVAGAFRLTVADVNPTARGGALVIGPQGVQQFALTDALRAGVRDFVFDVPASLTVATLSPPVIEAPPPTGGASPTVAAAIELAETAPTATTAISFTQAPVNETGAGVGPEAGATAVAVAGAPLSGAAGRRPVRRRGLMRSSGTASTR
jgi:hypothetical protein